MALAARIGVLGACRATARLHRLRLARGLVRAGAGRRRGWPCCSSASADGSAASDAGDLWAVGWAVVLTTAAPLFGALYRVRLGGAALRELGPAGFQFGLTELRLCGLRTDLGLGQPPGVAARSSRSRLWCSSLFRALGMVELGPLGDIPRLLPADRRGLAAPLSAPTSGPAPGCRWPARRPSASGRLVALEAWELDARTDPRHPRRPGVGATAPGAGRLALMMLIEARAPGEELFGLAHAPGRAPVAVAVGIGFGMLLSFVQAPLAVGVLGAVYCDQRAERAAGASQPATALIRRSLSPAPTLWHQPFEAQR